MDPMTIREARAIAGITENTREAGDDYASQFGSLKPRALADALITLAAEVGRARSDSLLTVRSQIEAIVEYVEKAAGEFARLETGANPCAAPVYNALISVRNEIRHHFPEQCATDYSVYATATPLEDMKRFAEISAGIGVSVNTRCDICGAWGRHVTEDCDHPE